MPIDAQHYRICIVRVWREDTHSHEPAWRITLELPADGIRRGVQSRDELIDVLCRYLFEEQDWAEDL